jgi:cytochrome c-type biogenesis protein CcmH
MIRFAPLAVALMLTLTVPAGAVQPDEMLADPALEARAREISRDVRCPVCQGESIDDSNAQISKDLRIIIRERLVAGDTNEEVIEFLVARYGEFVLFDPPKTGINLVLWLAGPAMLLAGGAIAVAAMRRRKGTAEDTLTAEEQARLDQILKG